MTTRTAECGCGRLKITVQGEPSQINICHCDFCQKRTGSAFTLTAVYADDDLVEIIGDSTVYNGLELDGEGVKIPGMPEIGVNYHFCPVCGSTVYITMTGVPGVRVSVGNFVDPQFPAPLAECYSPMRHHWLTTPPGAESFDTYPPL